MPALYSPELVAEQPSLGAKMTASKRPSREAISGKRIDNWTPIKASDSPDGNASAEPHSRNKLIAGLALIRREMESDSGRWFGGTHDAGPSSRFDEGAGIVRVAWGRDATY